MATTKQAMHALAAEVTHLRLVPKERPPGGFDYHGGGVLSKVRKTDGKRVYYVQYRYRGRRITEKVGLSEERARGRIESRREAIDNGKVPEPARKSSKRVRFRELAKQFEEDYRGRAGKGAPRSTYYKQQTRQLVAIFGARFVDEIDAAMVDRYRARLEGEGLSLTTVRKRLIALGTILRQARRWGQIETTPDIVKPGEKPLPFRDLNPAEWARVLATLRAAADVRPWELPLARFCLATASRRQEALGLTWGDVRGEHMLLEQGKTGSRKKVPVGKVVAEVLAAREPYRGKSEHVFCGEGLDRLNGRFVSRIFADRLEQAGIASTRDGRASLHGLRTTAATWLAAAGMGEPLIACLLGHKLSSASVTARYIRLSEVPREVVDRLDALIVAAEALPIEVGG